MEELKYKAKLAGYHISKKSTGTVGTVLGGAAVFALALNTGINISTNELDPTGTDRQAEVLAALQEQKADLLSLTREYQALQRESHVQDNAEELQNTQNALQNAGQRFFTDLFTSGSMQQGLDVGETDVRDLLNGLKLKSGDFDWGTHVHPHIPQMMRAGIRNTRNLDEARARHRYEGTESLEQGFEIAENIARGAKMSSENRVFGIAFSVMVSLLLGLGGGAAISAAGENAARMRRPVKPPPQPKH